jgi:hypothetical protein
MGTIKIDEKLLGYMSQFYALTNVEAKDVAEDDENIFSFLSKDIEKGHN